MGQGILSRWQDAGFGADFIANETQHCNQQVAMLGPVDALLGKAFLHKLLKGGNRVPCNASIVSADQLVWAQCAGQGSPVSGDRSSEVEDDQPDTVRQMQWAR
jgi:hypothetical protein